MIGFVSQRHRARSATSRTAAGPIRLTELQYGDRAVVQAVDGPDWFRDRLHAVGLVAGAEIKVLRACCPLVIHLDGGRFSLRREDADRISVSLKVAEAA